MIKNAVGWVCFLSIQTAIADNAHKPLLPQQSALPPVFEQSLNRHLNTHSKPVSIEPLRNTNVAALNLAQVLDTQQQTPIKNDSQKDAALLSKAKILIEQKSFDDAYQLLLPQEDDLAGDLAYDQLLAESALATGNANIAIMALERAAAINPSDLKTRSLLAQAYYQLGELEASKAEFQALLENDAPQKDAEVINEFIGAIDRKLKGGSKISAYIETGLGWDSNVNSATNDPTTAYSIPGFTFDDLASTAGEVSSAFMQLTGGVAFSVPVTEGISYIGSLRFNKTLNRRFKEFEVASADLSGGIQYKYGKNTLSLNLQNNHFYVDDDYFRQAYGVLGQWQHTLNDHQQFSIYSQYSKLEFEDFDARDADRYLIGANYVQAFKVKYSPILFGSIYVAKEDANDEVWDHDVYGLRAGGQLKLAPKWTLYSTLGYENREYDGIDLLFNEVRKDRQYDVSLGLNYTPAPLWTIKPKISYIKNDANVLLYEYDRSLFTVNVQRDFNW